MVPMDSEGNLNAVKPRKIDIKESDIGFELLDQRQCFVSIRCLSQDSNTVFLEQHLDSLPYHLVVIDEDHFNTRQDHSIENRCSYSALQAIPASDGVVLASSLPNEP